MFGNLFKKNKKPACILCNSFLTPEEAKTNEIRYEHAEGESTLGAICNNCADTLDRSDILTETEVEDE